MLRHCHQIEYLGEQKTLPCPPPPLHSKLGCWLFLAGSFNSRKKSQWRVEATKRQKEIVGQSVSTNFFYFYEKFFHQFVHIIELTQQREKNRFSLKFGLSANWMVIQTLTLGGGGDRGGSATGSFLVLFFFTNGRLLSKLRVPLLHLRKHGARNHVVDSGKAIALKARCPCNVVEVGKS